MKSNRTRLRPQVTFTSPILGSLSLARTVRLSEMPAPASIAEISPEQVVTDILISTLERVQRSANPAVAAAAARYLETLR